MFRLVRDCVLRCFAGVLQCVSCATKIGYRYCVMFMLAIVLACVFKLVLSTVQLSHILALKTSKDRIQDPVDTFFYGTNPMCVDCSLYIYIINHLTGGPPASFPCSQEVGHCEQPTMKESG